MRRLLFDEAQIELGLLPIVAPAPTNKFWIKVAGVWKDAVTWIKVVGVWKQADPKIEIAGIWK